MHDNREKRGCSRIKPSFLHWQSWEEHQNTKITIVSLSLKSKSINAIVHEGIKIGRQTVARIVKRYNEDGSLADKPALGGKPILTLENMTFIEEKMEANDE